MNSKINIFHVCGDYHDVHKNLIDSLDSLSIQSKILKYNLKSKKLNKSYKDIDYFNNGSIWPGPIFFRKKIKDLATWIENNYEMDDFNLIHAHMLFTDGSIAYELNKKYGIPYIVAVRNSDLYSWFFWKIPWIKKLGIEVLNNASRIIFLSESYKKHLIDLLPRKMKKYIIDKSCVIPNGIDDFWLHNKYISSTIDNEKDKISVLTVGRIEKNKNQSLVMKALIELRNLNMNIDYTVVGELTNIKIGKLLMQENFITIVPKKSKEDLIHYYRNTNIYVMASHKETFGLTYAEAMSQGKPLVYTKSQGFDEQFPDGVVGYSVDSYDYKDIAEAVLKIKKNYNNISRNCYNFCEEFSYKSLSLKYFDLYNKVIN